MKLIRPRPLTATPTKDWTRAMKLTRVSRTVNAAVKMTKILPIYGKMFQSKVGSPKSNIPGAVIAQETAITAAVRNEIKNCPVPSVGNRSTQKLPHHHPELCKDWFQDETMYEKILRPAR